MKHQEIKILSFQIIMHISVCSFNLNTTAKLPPVGKLYMCFQIDCKYAQTSRCVKSKIMTKEIDCALYINKF